MSSSYFPEFSSEIENLHATFHIKINYNSYNNVSLKDHFSSALQLNQLGFKLGANRPTNGNGKLLFFLTFQLPEPATGSNSIFALVVIDYDILETSRTALVGNDLFFKVLNSDVKVNLGELSPTYNNGVYPKITVNVKFKLLKIFDCTSTLFFSLEPPSKVPLFRLLNQRDISNCSFQLQSSDTEIWVNKHILSNECPFFEKMLQKEWCKTSDDGTLLTPIKFSVWSDEAIIIILLHLHTGWLPGTTICDEVFQQLNIKNTQLVVEHTVLLEVHEIAEMLELHILAFFAALEAKLYITKKVDSLLQKITNITFPL